VLIAGLAGSNNWAFRPQLLAYPLFVLTLAILWDWHNGRSHRLWVLPLISILWVNLHGSFPLLFILLAPALIFGAGDRKRLLIASAACAAALLLNPHGAYAGQYVASMLASASNRYSNEWLPAVNRGWQANLFFLWFLVIAPLAAWSRRRLTVLEWAWLLIFGWLGLYGARYGIWLLFILCPLTASLLSEWAEHTIDRPIEHERPPINLAAAGLLLLFPLAFLPGVRENWWPTAPPPYDGANPIEAVNWLAEHPELRGPLWSDFSHASYLIYALPSRTVWIDPRFELYPPAQWERYLTVASASPDWQVLLDEEQANLVMLSTGGEPRLIQAMQDSAVWCQQYRDENAVIFTRAIMASDCP
jgi:MFS family permease